MTYFTNLSKPNVFLLTVVFPQIDLGKETSFKFIIEIIGAEFSFLEACLQNKKEKKEAISSFTFV